MKNKEFIKIILPFIIVVTTSIFAYQYLTVFLSEYTINDGIVNKVELRFNYGVYIQCFSVLFTLISLPFLFSVFSTKWKIDKNNWWKAILSIELVGLLIAYMTTPPDLMSTIILFIVWQMSIIINLISLIWITRKNDLNVHNNT